MSPVISVENLSKKYIIGHQKQERYTALRDVLANGAKRFAHKLTHPFAAKENDPTHEEFWALKDVNFDIQQGDRVGIIGRNGAGKSTLLKILSRTTEPTSGKISINGRVATLLEVGTGFHPELTGRENIYLNGAILGMSRVEITKKFDEIVDFAEVEKFLDTPVKRYSSGMYVRLAFSVAAHLESDILIVDEVLAVGDTGFQKKCMGRMESVTNEGRTILFVSHNMGAISELCTKAVLLDKGRLQTVGNTPKIIKQYARMSLNEQEVGIDIVDDERKPCSIVSLRLCNSQGENATTFDIADDVVMEVKYRVRQAADGLQLTITLLGNMIEIFNSNDTDDDAELPLRSAGTYVARYTIPGMVLKAGNYSASVFLGTPDQLIQSLKHALSFDVEEWSINTHSKGYRRERPGHLVSPGQWETKFLEGM